MKMSQYLGQLQYREFNVSTFLSDIVKILSFICLIMHSKCSFLSTGLVFCFLTTLEKGKRKKLVVFSSH